jgi:hypothetical protein
MEFDNELAELWDNTEADDGFSPLPDKKYIAKVERCEFTRTKETDKPMFAWDFVIEDEEYEGRHVFLNRVLQKGNKQSVKYAKSDFAKLGLTAATFKEFIDSLGYVLDKKIELQLKTKTGKDGKKYQNVFINKEITDVEQFGKEVW